MVVACRYRLQLSFARGFLQRLFATIKRAHQDVMGEYFTKGIIGFMGPRSASGASARIAMWLFMFMALC